MQRKQSGISLAALCLATVYCLSASGSALADGSAEGQSASRFSYGGKGMQFDDGSGNNFLWFGVRVQTRWTGSRVTDDELPGAPIEQSAELAVNRARLKLGGHLIRPAFTVYSEYDVVGERLLDLRATYEFTDWLSLRVGQWKSEFNRERIDSSGRQQFVERSIVTPWFTVDRQQGVMASGRLATESRADTSYWFGWLHGAGRGGDPADADGLWLARLQWNFAGRVLGFSQSAVRRPKEPAGSVAIAAVSGKSGFTAFSSSGGGQLPGFSAGPSDRYRIEQLMIETAYQHGGFSWQQELHWKNIEDGASGEKTRLVGAYAQAGMFFSEIIESFPKPLELAVRVARVDPDRDRDDNAEKEFTACATWFFDGHRNKLTLDISRVVRRLAPESDSSNRVRLQWDWSF